jgi:iron complex transport system ATP-binding protein
VNLIARDLHVRLGQATILHGVDFEARAGEITAIVGPNGSGKTTLLRALTGEVPPGGTVLLNGRPIAGMQGWELAAMRAVLPQSTPLAFPFTVSEVVRLGLSASARGAGQEAIAAAALGAVDLSRHAAQLYQKLSGGEQQRVQLARVLTQVWDPVGPDGPRWLFLDEPVASLDVAHQLAVMDVARSYAARGGGVVAVMHDLNLTAMFAARTTVMSTGRVAAAGTTAEVFRDELLSTVYGCPMRLGVVPDDDTFFLPQACRSAEGTVLGRKAG